MKCDLCGRDMIFVGPVGFNINNTPTYYCVHCGRVQWGRGYVTGNPPPDPPPWPVPGGGVVSTGRIVPGGGSPIGAAPVEEAKPFVLPHDCHHLEEYVMNPDAVAVRWLQCSLCGRTRREDVKKDRPVWE